MAVVVRLTTWNARVGNRLSEKTVWTDGRTLSVWRNGELICLVLWTGVHTSLGAGLAPLCRASLNAALRRTFSKISVWTSTLAKFSGGILELIVRASWDASLCLRVSEVHWGACAHTELSGAVSKIRVWTGSHAHSCAAVVEVVRRRTNILALFIQGVGQQIHRTLGLAKLGSGVAVRRAGGRGTTRCDHTNFGFLIAEVRGVCAGNYTKSVNRVNIIIVRAAACQDADIGNGVPVIVGGTVCCSYTCQGSCWKGVGRSQTLKWTLHQRVTDYSACRTFKGADFLFFVPVSVETAWSLAIICRNVCVIVILTVHSSYTTGSSWIAERKISTLFRA